MTLIKDYMNMLINLRSCTFCIERDGIKTSFSVTPLLLVFAFAILCLIIFTIMLFVSPALASQFFKLISVLYRVVGGV